MILLGLAQATSQGLERTVPPPRLRGDVGGAWEERLGGVVLVHHGAMFKLRCDGHQQPHLMRLQNRDIEVTLFEVNYCYLLITHSAQPGSRTFRFLKVSLVTLYSHLVVIPMSFIPFISRTSSNTPCCLNPMYSLFSASAHS